MSTKIDVAQEEMIVLKLNVLYPSSKFTYMGRWEKVEKNEFTNDHEFEGINVRVRVFEPIKDGEKKSLVYAILE